MTASSILAAFIVLGACFGLMVWGQRYLGEEKGRNPGKPGEQGTDGAIENPCAACRGCADGPKKAPGQGGTSPDA